MKLHVIIMVKIEKESTAIEKKQVKIMGETITKYFKHLVYFKICLWALSTIVSGSFMWTLLNCTSSPEILLCMYMFILSDYKKMLAWCLFHSACLCAYQTLVYLQIQFLLFIKLVYSFNCITSKGGIWLKCISVCV